jgi:hypothetical protein
MALEPQAMFVSRDQQWNNYAAGRFEESEAEYRRSQTLDGNHFEPDFVALLRALASPDTDVQTLRDRLQRVLAAPNLQPLPQWWRDFGAASPNRRKMLAVLRKAGETGGLVVEPQLADALGDRDLALSFSRSQITHTRGATGTGGCRGCWFTPAHAPIRALKS